ncbi:MAG: 4Fe-4S dicluster domain-containing protein [Spirochaetes bacterium]|nr:MAG: 4Fe-4S dicluster domain-containing protein [Spirochaetota bacterium]
MTHVENILFTILLTGAGIAFLYSLTRLARFVLIGGVDDRLKGTFIKRFNTMIAFAFLQRRVIAEGYGWNHFLIFWGFLALLLANFEFVLSGLFPGFKYTALVNFSGMEYLYTGFDLISLLVLATILIAIARRVLLRPAHIEALSRDAFIILGLIAGLMLAYFGLQGAEIALGGGGVSAPMPVSGVVAAALSSTDPAVPGALMHLFWWLHAVILLCFLNYLPYSKHMHILAAIPNCFCRSFEFVTTVPREEFKKGAPNGVSSIAQFSWKDLLDFTACTECGRCNKNCPATVTGKPLNPRIVIHQGKENLLANGGKILGGNLTRDITPLIGETDGEATVSEKALWACTTCGACMENCPVFIEHVPKMVKMRRHLVEDRSKFPEELMIFFEAIENRSNPWGIAPSDRGKWAAGTDVAHFTKDAGLEYLLYVGCAGSFDSRAKKVTAAVVKSLRAAGVSFGILGNDEKCCGDSLRRLGNEFVFDRMARANVEQFNALGVKKIITTCPHCFSTFNNDYRQFGLEAQVVHHSVFLNTLIEEGALKLEKANGAGRIVMHDSCYLGRYNKIYKEPRALIQKATGHKAVEMDRKLSKSFCCGAGGGRMWMEEEPEHRININRVKEALDKKPDAIAVSCPYCLTMFVDGVKDMKALDKVQVLDVAEIISERIKA